MISEIFGFLRELVGFGRDRQKINHTPIAEAERAEAKAKEKKEEIREAVEPDAPISEIREKTRYPGP